MLELTQVGLFNRTGEHSGEEGLPFSLGGHGLDHLGR